jgi:hypothetical protein
VQIGFPEAFPKWNHHPTHPQNNFPKHPQKHQQFRMSSEIPRNSNKTKEK